LSALQKRIERRLRRTKKGFQRDASAKETVCLQGGKAKKGGKGEQGGGKRG